MSTSTTTRRRLPPIAVVAISLSFALGVGVGVLRVMNAEPVERDAELLGNIAFMLIYMSPAMLGLMASSRGPGLLVSAGVLDLVLAFIAVFSVGVIFLVPATLFLVAGGRMSRETTSWVRVTAPVVVTAVGGALAFFALLAHDDPLCWAKDPATGEMIELDADRFVRGSTTSISSSDLPRAASQAGCSSDSVSASEAGWSVVVIVATLGAAWAVGEPRRTEASEGPTSSLPVTGV